jgi:hypothetical protein
MTGVIQDEFQQIKEDSKRYRHIIYLLLACIFLAFITGMIFERDYRLLGSAMKTADDIPPHFDLMKEKVGKKLLVDNVVSEDSIKHGFLDQDGQGYFTDTDFMRSVEVGQFFEIKPFSAGYLLCRDSTKECSQLILQR